VSSSTKSGSLTYAQAKEINDASNSLLEALRQGRIIARGRPYFYEFDGPGDKPGEFVAISQEQWFDYEIDENLNSLIDDEMHHAFNDVQIGKTELLKLGVDVDTSVSENKGGRPATHDWENIWEEILIHFNTNGAPETLSEWVKRLTSELPHFGSNKVPEESTIRRKLRPAFNKLKGRS
jgi:hypothetical protein